jgi:cytochrome P450
VPLIGAKRHLARDPLSRLTALRDTYGGVVDLGPMAGATFLLVSDPGAVKHVLLDNQRNYRKGRAAQRMVPIFGRGSLLLESDEWVRRRRLVKPAFHRENLELLGENFVNATKAMLVAWRPRIDAGAPIDVREEMLKLTMALTVKNMFHADASGDLHELVDAWNVLYDQLTRSRFSLLRLPAWIPNARNRRRAHAASVVRRVLDKYIQSARLKPVDHRSLLSLLVHARDEEGGPAMNDDELRAEVTTMFIGGYDTGSTALSFTLALLAHHADVAAVHRAELDSALGGRTPAAADLDRLPLNRMILQESMRLFPPSWVITREAIGSDILNGYDIPAGAQLLVSAWVVQHDPSLWPAPTRFDPARFTPAAIESRPRFAYLPFGGGPRMCLGDQYAMIEMQLVLAVICNALELTLRPGCEIGAVAQLGLRPAQKLELIARTRRAGTDDAARFAASGANW